MPWYFACELLKGVSGLLVISSLSQCPHDSLGDCEDIALWVSSGGHDSEIVQILHLCQARTHTFMHSTSINLHCVVI